GAGGRVAEAPLAVVEEEAGGRRRARALAETLDKDGVEIAVAIEVLEEDARSDHHRRVAPASDSACPRSRRRDPWDRASDRRRRRGRRRHRAGSGCAGSAPPSP